VILSELKRKLGALFLKHAGIYFDVDMTWDVVTITGYTREASCSVMLTRIECESAVVGEDGVIDKAVDRILDELHMSPEDVVKQVSRAMQCALAWCGDESAGRDRGGTMRLMMNCGCGRTTPIARGSHSRCECGKINKTADLDAAPPVRWRNEPTDIEQARYETYKAHDEAKRLVVRVNAFRRRMGREPISLPELGYTEDLEKAKLSKVAWCDKVEELKREEKELFRQLSGQDGTVRASYRGKFGFFEYDEVCRPQLDGGVETSSDDWFDGMEGHDVEVIVIDHGPVQP
jgi:hypothetical protein